MKFIHFGCWGNLHYKNPPNDIQPVYTVFEKIKDIQKNTDIDFLIVAEDNY